jgi:hypothetical protein
VSGHGPRVHCPFVTIPQDRLHHCPDALSPLLRLARKLAGEMVDSDPMSYPTSPTGKDFAAILLSGRDAARLMKAWDGGAPGEEGSPIG